MRLLSAALLVLATLTPATLASPLRAHASDADFVGVRALGMGGALRAAATGDAAPMLNPSGAAMVKAYAVEAAYQHLRPGGGHTLHASVVDGTSAYNIGAGLYYSFTTASQAGVATKTHDAGLSLSAPLGERVFLGATGRYLWDKWSRSDTGDVSHRGFTLDTGLTVRLAQRLSLAAVGYNLMRLDSQRAPRMFGAGAAFAPIAELLVTADTLVDFTDADPNRGAAVSVMGGAEYVVASKTALRLGGGRDALREGAFVAGGLSLLSEIGALDAGLRQDVAGRDKATFIGVSMRLFVPGQ
jgi:hypothetical protein